MKIPLEKGLLFVPDTKNTPTSSSENTTTGACQQDWNLKPHCSQYHTLQSHGAAETYEGVMSYRY